MKARTIGRTAIGAWSRCVSRMVLWCTACMLGLVLCACTWPAANDLSEAEVPARFGPVQPIAIASDVDCYSAVFRISQFFDASASVGAPPGGDVARKTTSLAPNSSADRYADWRTGAAPIPFNDNSVQARTVARGPTCGGGLPPPYGQMIESRREGQDYSFRYGRHDNASR